MPEAVTCKAVASATRVNVYLSWRPAKPVAAAQLRVVAHAGNELQSEMASDVNRVVHIVDFKVLCTAHDAGWPALTVCFAPGCVRQATESKTDAGPNQEAGGSDDRECHHSTPDAGCTGYAGSSEDAGF